MSSDRDHLSPSIGRRVGPCLDGHECEHGGPTLSIDPEPRTKHVRPCNQEAVYHVPWPSGNVVGTRPVCSYHLERVLASDDELRAALRADSDVDEYRPDRAFVALEDAPAEIERFDTEWIRIGVDQRGDAHYFQPGEAALLVLSPEFHVETTQYLRGRSFTAWLEHVAKRRGWAAFDERVRRDRDHGRYRVDDDQEPDLVTDGGRPLQNDEDEEDLIPACPYCGYGSIEYHHARDHYRCKDADCRRTFDEPDNRELDHVARRDRSGGLSDAGRILYEASPDTSLDELAERSGGVSD